MTRPNDSSLIGQSIARPKARQFTSGRGRYTDDVRVPGLLHAAFLRSPHAHARIVSIALDQARLLPGVSAVYTADEILSVCKPWTTTFKLIPGHRSPPQPALAQERALWQGQPVALVIAASRAIAEDAVALIEVEWESYPALTSAADALAEGAAVLHPELGSNLLFEHRIRSADAQTAFDKADHVVRRQLRFPRHTGVPLEGRAILAEFDPTQETLTVHASTQIPHQLRAILAAQLGLGEHRVRVLVPDVGGGFGIKLHTYDDEMAVCAAAVLLGRPVKFICDRLEAFASDNHARGHQVSAAIACDEQGIIRGFSTDDVMEAGAFSAYPRTSVLEGLHAITMVGAPYAAPSLDAHLRIAFQNKPHVGSYRGVGQPIGCAVTEMLVDAAARKLQIDPAEFRRRNYRNAAVCGNISAGGVDMGGELTFIACHDRLLEMMNYPQLRTEQAEARRMGRHLGIGFACFVEASATGPMFYGNAGIAIAASDGCSVRLEPTGSVTCITSSQFQGQGLEVGLAQLAAQTLGVPFDSVSIVHGDTAVTPMGGGTYASRGLAIGGEAALLAARGLRERILAAAASMLESSVGDLELIDSQVRIRGTDRALTLAEIGFTMHYRQHLMPPDVPTDPMVTAHYASKRPYLVANGIQASLVEIDPESGFVRLLRHWVVEDCGRVVNPMLVDEQIRGAVVQGIGAALFEECLYDEQGQLLSATMADYLVPMAADMPDIEIGHIETPVPDTLLGGKGVGESGIVGAAVAVANAVNDALAPLGAEISDLPITPERMLRALGRVP